MFHFGKAPAIGLSVAVAAVSAFVGAVGSAPPRTPPHPITVSTSVAQPSQPECRAPDPVIDAEIQRLRQSCELELEAFAECRASRPAWDSVELFSCGFEMSTSLARGDVEDPASLQDCGASAAARAHPADCPVPACEGELEALEALKAEPAC